MRAWLVVVVMTSLLGVIGCKCNGLFGSSQNDRYRMDTFRKKKQWYICARTHTYMSCSRRRRGRPVAVMSIYLNQAPASYFQGSAATLCIHCRPFNPANDRRAKCSLQGSY